MTSTLAKTLTKIFCLTIFFVYSYYAGTFWFNLLNSGIGTLTVLEGILVLVLPILWIFLLFLALGSLASKYETKS